MESRLTLICTALLLLSSLQSTTACSCLPTKRPLEETFAESRAVFIGTAISVKEDTEAFERIIVFKATEIFKGSKCKKKTFTIYTALQSATCGVYVTEGQQWQIWATGTPKRLQIGLCGESTTDVNRNIDFLRQQVDS